MAVILPILAFPGWVIVLANERPEGGWRLAFLRAAVLWGSYAIVVTELLSPFRAVTRLGLALAWILPLTLAGAWLIRRRRRGEVISLPRLKIPGSWLDRILLAGLVVILGATALVGWLAPPQTWDSLVYHMPRVAHWAQEDGVRPFATGIDVQNNMTPGAEMLVLQTYVLSGGDRLANFVSWFAMLGSLVGASLIAARLGAGRRGQLLAALVAATIPMGIVQASSTTTDYVESFWVVAAALESLDAFSRRPAPDRLIFASLAAGLALVTKPVAVAYLIPFGILAAIGLFRGMSLPRAVGWSLVALLLVFCLNAGHLTRNYLIYGSPISREQGIELHANQLRTPAGVLSNLLRNAALQTGTPFPALNRWVYQTVFKAHVKIGVDINDPRTTSVGPYRPMPKTVTSEDLTGNLVHAILIVVVTPAVLLGWRRLGALSLIYMLTVIAGFFLFSLIFKWQIFGGRYELPFFILYAPLLGRALAGLLPPTAASLVGVVLLVCSLPWVFSIDSRPLLPIPGRSYLGSILTEPRERLYFANNLYLIGPYETMVGRVMGQGCTAVGVMVSGHGAEYPLWVLLGAPDPQLEIEWIVGGTPSEQFAKTDFQPCAVICQKCPAEWQEVRGLPKVYENGEYRLFLKP